MIAQQEHRAPLVYKQEMNMSKKLKFVFLAAVVGISITSPVLAAGYDEFSWVPHRLCRLGLAMLRAADGLAAFG